jgi:hypothetical protein
MTRNTLNAWIAAKSLKSANFLPANLPAKLYLTPDLRSRFASP